MQDEAGQPVVEWILIAVIIVSVAVVVYRLVGDEIRSAGNRLIAWIRCAWQGSTCPTQG
jgi:Flp pilus assembly pilin Flp